MVNNSRFSGTIPLLSLSTTSSQPGDLSQVRFCAALGATGIDSGLGFCV